MAHHWIANNNPKLFEDMLKEIYGDDLSGLFDDDDDYSARFSADNKKSIDSGIGTFIGAVKNIATRSRQEHDERIRIHTKNAREAKAAAGMGEIGLFSSILSFPSRIAEKVPAFKAFFNMAQNAMDLQLKTRNHYNRELNRAYEGLSKDDKETLREILMEGELTAKEYGKGITDTDKRIAQIMKETGANRKVANSYIIIRELFKEAYNKLNRIRQQVQRKSESMSKSKLDKLKENDFVEIIGTPEKLGDDEYLVTYDERPSWEKNYIVDENALKLMQDDNAVQVLNVEDISENFDRRHRGQYKDEKIKFGKDSKVYQVHVREAIGDLSNKEGYIPHFFHDFFVVVENKDGSREVVDSGRTQEEAVNKAESYLKDNPKTDKIIISPKRFNFSSVGINEETLAGLIGDGKYQEINERIAKEYDMTLDEAKKILNAKQDKSIKGTGKHRFLGNLLHRKGSKGYEQKDLDWILAHYFNSVARYEALETEFKPKAVSLFERMYGRFDKEYSGTAKYTKDYINDVNGNPSALEKDINRALNNNPIWRKYVVSAYGDRAALQLAGSVTNTVSVLKLGVFNISSAALNFTQLLNSAALLSAENPGAAISGLMKACWQMRSEKMLENLSPDERRAIEESGVLDELGLDSGAGYHKLMVGKLAEKSMMFFKGSEALVRRGTVLAAYRQARNKGKNHDEAVRYAKELNRKANFDYGVHDAPNVFRRGSIISQILLQFQKYPIKQFELMREMLGKGTTKQQKMVFWGGYLLLAGAFGLPAEDLLWEIFGLVPGLFGFDLKESVKQFGLETTKDANPLTKFAIRTMMYGIASNLNIDISSRFGMADIVPWTGPNYNKDAGFFTNLFTTAGSVTGATIAQTFNNLANGEGLNGIMRVISPGLANIYWAVEGERRDARNRITNRYDDAWSRLIRALGFRSLDETLAVEVQSMKYNEMDRTSKEKQDAIDDFLDAEADGKPLGKYAKRLNELGVKKETVKKARENRKKDRMQRGFDKDVPDYAIGAMSL